MPTKAQIISKLSSRGWVTLQQASKLIGVSYPTILKIRKRNEISTIRVGRTWRVYEEELLRYLKEGSEVKGNKVTPKPEPKDFQKETRGRHHEQF